MEKVIVLRFGEIYLKGKNRFSFEKQLLDNIKFALKGIKFSLNRMHGRYLIENIEDEALFEIESRVKRVFGLHSYSVALKMPTDLELLKKECLAFLPEKEARVSQEEKDWKPQSEAELRQAENAWRLLHYWRIHL